MVERSSGRWWPILVAVALGPGGCAPRGPASASPRSPAPSNGPPARVDTQIVTSREATTESELLARGRAALEVRDFATAIEAFELLLAAQPRQEILPEILFGLATANDELHDRASARSRYRQLAAEFPADKHARSALLRAIELHVYLEEWRDLDAAGAELLARDDLQRIDRVAGLSARALASVEMGDDAAATARAREAIDIVEDSRLGEAGRLPAAVAQLRFAQAEIRRVRSERIVFVPVEGDFGAVLEARCAGLLDAQRAYTEAMHAEDAHWAAMAGYRVGEMYKTLHRDVMAVPTPARVKTDKDQQIFFAAMHLRYRILLDKGLRMLRGTIDLATKTHDTSAWIERAATAANDLDAAIQSETAIMASFPFSEAEMKRALEILIAEGGAAGAGARSPRHGEPSRRESTGQSPQTR